MSHYPPVEILTERGQLSQDTFTYLSCSLSGVSLGLGPFSLSKVTINTFLSTLKVRREQLRPGTEFWDSAKTLKVLAEGEYFNTSDSGQFVWPEVIKKFVDDKDSLGLTASEEGDPAVRALGALVWYLKVGRSRL